MIDPNGLFSFGQCFSLKIDIQKLNFCFLKLCWSEILRTRKENEKKKNLISNRTLSPQTDEYVIGQEKKRPLKIKKTRKKKMNANICVFTLNLG